MKTTESIRMKYENQTAISNKSGFMHYSDYTDYGDLVDTGYSEDATTLMSPNLVASLYAFFAHVPVTT